MMHLTIANDNSECNSQPTEGKGTWGIESPSISNKNKFMDSRERLSTIYNTPSQWLCERLWV